MRRALVALACLGALGCTRTPREPAVRAPKACSQLAKSFALIAQQRNDGMTRSEQTNLAKRSARSDASLRHWLNVIDLVDRFEDGTSPQEIGMTVLDRCEVDAQGRASVTTIWPAAELDVAAPPTP